MTRDTSGDPNRDRSRSTPAVVPQALVLRGLRRRRQALRALDSMGPESVDVVLDMLRSEHSRRLRVRVTIAALVVAYVCMIASMVATGQTGPIGGSMGAFSAVVASVILRRRLQRKAARKLTEFDDIRAVGFLADALHYRDRALVPLAMRKLTALLPRLRASDAGLMTDGQKLSLYKALRLSEDAPPRPDEADFMAAALRALEQIGDERALPYVDGIALQHPPRSLDEERVVAAAMECLPALRERVEQQRVAMTLLRSSDAPSEGADHLLRATYGPGGSDPELLLRPSDAPGGDA